MRNVGKRRSAYVLTGVLAALAVTTTVLLMTSQAAPPAGEQAVAVASSECGGLASTEASADAFMTPDDSECGDCPKKLAGQPSCSRASCDPCCYRCVGDPILRCY